MFYFIGDIIICLCWGILIALILTGGLFYLPKLLVTRYSYSALSIGLLLIGFCFFTFQSILLVGGIKAKGHIPSVEQMKLSGVITGETSLSNKLINAYPMFKDYIIDVENTQNKFSNTADLTTYYIGIINHKVNLYIWKHLGWIVGTLILLAVFLINDTSKQSRKSVTTYHRRMPD